MSPESEQITLADVYRRHLEREPGPYDDIAGFLGITATIFRTEQPDGPLALLEAVVSLRQLLAVWEQRLVDDAREGGIVGGVRRRPVSWQAIGDVVGMTRQSAWVKFGGRDSAAS